VLSVRHRSTKGNTTACRPIKRDGLNRRADALAASRCPSLKVE